MDNPAKSRWYLRVPPGRWYDDAMYMINTRKRGRKGKSVAYMVHRRRNTIDTLGFTTHAWEYVTYTLTLDDAKSVAQLLYASNNPEN